MATHKIGRKDKQTNVQANTKPYKNLQYTKRGTQ